MLHFLAISYKSTLSVDDVKTVKKEINKYTVFILSSIISSFKDSGLYLNDNDKSICNYLFDSDVDKDSLENILEKNTKKRNYEYSFSNEVLELVNSVYGEVYHELEDIYISESIDFKFIKKNSR